MIGVFADTAGYNTAYARYLQQGSCRSTEDSACTAAVADERSGGYCPHLWQLTQGYLVLLGIHWLFELVKE
jgi:hypothetical protein